MKRRLLLNPKTGTYHVHERCYALVTYPHVLEQLQEVEVEWHDVPNLKGCGFCMPGLPTLARRANRTRVTETQQ